MEKAETQGDIENILVPKEQVSKAVQALCQYVQKKEEQTMSLTGPTEGQDIQLQLIMRKVPRTKNVKIKITLPTSLVSDTTDVCLFVKDLDKKSREHEETSRHFKEMLLEKGIKNIAEVVPLKALKLEYGPYEAKRNLSNMYDVFLADSSIFHRLPPLLGKLFYGRKKYPVQVDLKAKDLQSEVKKALHTAQCIITGKGSSCLTTVAHTGLPEAQITDNVMTAIQTLAQKVPGGQANVHSLHVKTPDSMAIPIFVCFSSGEGVELPIKPKKPVLEEPEEISTLTGARVRVSRAGDIQVIPFKEGGQESGEEGEEKKEAKVAKAQSKKAAKNRKRKAKTLKTVEPPEDSAKDTEVEVKSELEEDAEEEMVVKTPKSAKKAKKAQEEPSPKRTKLQSKTASPASASKSRASRKRKSVG